jgi:ABC-type cobalamin/Fe3+-siderophores transport system ATPase subunit
LLGRNGAGKSTLLQDAHRYKPCSIRQHSAQ